MHGRNMLQLSDLTELRRRQKAGTSLVRLQAEEYMDRQAMRAMMGTSSDDDDDDDDEGGDRMVGLSMIGKATIAPPNGDADGVPVIINVLGPCDEDDGDDAGSDDESESSSEQGDSSTGIAPAATSASGGCLPGAFVRPYEYAATADGGLPTTQPAADNRRAENLISQLRQFQRASAPATAPRSSTSNLTLEASVRAGGVFGATSDYSTRAGRQYGSSSPAAATAVPIPPQGRDPAIRPSLLTGSGAGSPGGVGALRDSSPAQYRLPAATGSSLYGSSGGADPSVRVRRASTTNTLFAYLPAVGSPGGASGSGGGGGVESPVSASSSSAAVGPPRPPNVPVGARAGGAVEASPRAMLAGLGDRSVRSLRTASATAMERPPGWLSLGPAPAGGDSGAGGGGGVSGGGNESSGSPVAARSGLGDKSVRGRRASVLMAAPSGSGMPPGGGGGGGGGEGPRPPASDASVRSCWRPVAMGEASVRGGGAGRGGSSSGPVATLPDLMYAPTSGQAVSLFKAITGAEPVGRATLPEPAAAPPAVPLVPEPSAKSARAMAQLAQLQLLQHQHALGLADAGGGAATTAAGGAGAAAARHRHASTSQIELAAPSGPKLPKIGGASGGGGVSSSGQAGGAAAHPYSRTSTDNLGSLGGSLATTSRGVSFSGGQAQLQLLQHQQQKQQHVSGGGGGGGPAGGRTSRAAAASQEDDDAGLVSKAVKGLFHILKR
ncbi:hypothetical protein GPECTOR_59g638 [Gonium pectorale]|uniref:Uncharacterized protein n=1 Tax=Gonium pectorale TaxID=33097 RepID=A0A150G6R8_GONPE|nr:hypothetical protein GPECTOR_59g638 [Gonium pectorale]|eukprot:KXZ45030.1 hypothetical protein GPECTOR_59g638 [Gonium pectorale]